jgi:acetyl esterase/lipase
VKIRAHPWLKTLFLFFDYRFPIQTMNENTMFRILSLIVAALMLLSSGAQAEITVTENVTYGKVGDIELKLDIAQPEGEGPFPAIVCIHGGGWYQGSRQGYGNQIREAAKRGYVAVTVSYRLMKFDTKNRETAKASPIFPAQIHDAKTSIRWLRGNAKKYRVDPKRIGVTGGSAGGHLSLLIGLTDAKAKLEGQGGYADQSSRVQAVVNVFGPTEMASGHDTSSVAWIYRLFMGGKPDEVPRTYKLGSPLTYVSKGDPPVLTLHGDQDTLVPIAQAKLLDAKMKKVGADHTLMIFKGQGHGFAGEHRMKATQAMWDFFEMHLKPSR